MKSVEFEFEIGGDGESEHIFLSRDEYSRIFGKESLDDYLKFNPRGCIRCVEGILEYDTENVSVSFGMLYRLLSNKKGKRKVKLVVED